FTPTAPAGTHTWTGLNPLNGNWSSPLNWLNSSAPNPAESSVNVVFPAFSQNSAPVQDIVGLVIDQMEVRGGSYTFSRLNSAIYAFRGSNDTVLAGGNVTFAGTALVTLSGFPEFVVSNGV